jgi:NADH-quinone oxidoreductase subunit D
MMTSYFRIGGLALEPPLDFYEQVQDFLTSFPRRSTSTKGLLTGNPIWMGG